MNLRPSSRTRRLLVLAVVGFLPAQPAAAQLLGDTVRNVVSLTNSVTAASLQQVQAAPKLLGAVTAAAGQATSPLLETTGVPQVLGSTLSATTATVGTTLGTGVQLVGSATRDAVPVVDSVLSTGLSLTDSLVGATALAGAGDAGRLLAQSPPAAAQVAVPPVPIEAPSPSGAPSLASTPVIAASGMAAATLLGGDGSAAEAPPASRRWLHAQTLLAAYPGLVETDGAGALVMRGEVLALSPRAEALEAARNAGFSVREDEVLPGLDLRVVTLMAPEGVPAAQAVARLRTLDPGGRYDFNHLYDTSGEIASGRSQAGSAAASPLAGRIGLIDGGVAEGDAFLAGVRVVQRGFAGPAQPSAHATAVASLLVGRQGRFRGAAPGAALYVADVYGRGPATGTALAIANALTWMDENKVPVVNMSLVGPSNLVLQAAVQAAVARGHVIVAAVGNDGPAAPPLFPAAYPGVVAVSGVDVRRRLLPEAARGPYVAFAAPGADMVAAAPGGGLVSVRGTSFAAPLVAGRLAADLPAPDPGAARRAVSRMARAAIDLGPPGPDPGYGWGLVAFDLRIPPAEAVAAR